jgi:hypothetical protein
MAGRVALLADSFTGTGARLRGISGAGYRPEREERPPVPRASRLIPVAAAMTVGSARGAQAATAWPAHVFAPYVDTGLSNTTLTAVAADYGTQFFNLAFADARRRRHRRVVRGAARHRDALVLGGRPGQRRVPGHHHRRVHLQRHQPVRRCLHRCLPGPHLRRRQRRRFPVSDPTPTPTPTGSCAAAWSDTATYVSGNEVSYGGDNWTASQWNYDEAPGGASGAWNNEGAC